MRKPFHHGVERVKDWDGAQCGDRTHDPTVLRTAALPTELIAHAQPLYTKAAKHPKQFGPIAGDERNPLPFQIVVQ